MSVFGFAIGVIGTTAAIVSLINFSNRPRYDIGGKKQPVTIVRFQAGEFWKGRDATGHVPDVMLYDHHGVQLGHGHGKAKRIPAGAFFDLKVKQDKKRGFYQPSYVALIAGGHDAICLSGVQVEGPNEKSVGIPGNVPFVCGYESHPSITVIGDRGEAPDCFWLDKDHSYGLRTVGVSFYLQDFIANKKRSEAFLLDPDLYCNGSPRLHAYPWKMNVKSSIIVWSRPLEYIGGPLGVDKDPNRIKNWDTEIMWSDGSEKKHRRRLPQKSDEYLKPFRHSKRSPRPHVEMVNDTLVNPNDTVSDEPGCNCTDLFTETRTRTALPRFIVSDKVEHSAEWNCLSGVWEGTDYFSLSAGDSGLYCDMRTGALFPTCTEYRTRRCGDTQHNMVRVGPEDAPGPFSSFADLSVANATVFGNQNWNATINAVALWNLPYIQIQHL